VKRTTGRGPKAKGRAYENEVCAAILAAFPDLTDRDITARSSGDPGVDLILSTAAVKRLPFAFELKRTEQLKISQTIKQAAANGKKEGLPYCIIFRRSREESHVILRLSDFLEVLQRH
jgi:hypothetical protein